MRKIRGSFCLWVLCLAAQCLVANDAAIVMMQHFDPGEWEHVRINFDKLEDLSHELAKIKRNHQSSSRRVRQTSYYITRT